MKRWFPLTLLALALALLLDLFCRCCLPRPPLTVAEPVLPAPRGQPAPAEERSTHVSTAAEAPGDDALCVLPVLFPDGEQREISMAELLPGVVAAEMPASFEPEALCAQAVAARTYIYCRMGQPSVHGGAAVCTDPGCCQAWKSEAELRADWGADYERYREKIAAAVRSTDGMILTWEGSPILSCFHSSSPGRTESSAAVWKGALPYLVSVSSPESAADVPNFVTEMEVSPPRMAEVLSSLCSGFSPAGDAAQWLGSTVTDEAGRVQSVSFAGLSVSGEALRSALELRSTAFTVCWTGERFRFTVTGYGHGVGMSQYGAQVMARQGAGWREIVSHYYPGTEVSMN